MWKLLNRYFEFCRFAFTEVYPSTFRQRWKKILAFVVFFILGWIVVNFFGIRLIDIAKPIYHFLHWYGLVLLTLVCVIIFLLLLINGARKYHERIVSELHTDYKARMKRVEELSKMWLRGNEIRCDLDQFPTSHLHIWIDQVYQTLVECYGAAGKDKFVARCYDGYELDVPPQTKQEMWVKQTVIRLEELIFNEQPKSDDVNVKNLLDVAGDR